MIWVDLPATYLGSYGWMCLFFENTQVLIPGEHIDGHMLWEIFAFYIHECINICEFMASDYVGALRLQGQL